LQQLEKQHLPALDAPEFVQEIAERIPGIQTEIKQKVLADFHRWLEVVAESTVDVGEHSLAWMARQNEAKDRASGGGGSNNKPPPPQPSTPRMSVLSRASVSSTGDMSERAQQSVFELVHLTFEPLYECVHIFETLGTLGELQQSYTTQVNIHPIISADTPLWDHIKVTPGGCSGG